MVIGYKKLQNCIAFNMAQIYEFLYCFNYRLRSEGDNVLGSVRLSDLSRLNRLTYDRDI